MINKLTVFIVEDDEQACISFRDLIDLSESLTYIGASAEPRDSFSRIKNELPDVVILDLELHKGGGSGLDVLKEMQSAALPHRPFILVTTNNSSEIVYDAARSLGADYILSKHQEDYSEEYVVGMLEMMAPSIKGRKSSPPDQPAAEAPAVRDKRIRNRIMNELDLVGVSQTNKGYNYLVDAVFCLISEGTEISNICAYIAAKNGKTASSVERAMQNAINRAWATTSIDDLLEHYTAKIKSHKGVPTLTEFIYYYMNKIKKDL